MKLQSVAHIIRSSFRKGAPARLLEALADGCVKLKPSLARRYAPPASTLDDSIRLCPALLPASTGANKTA